MGFLVVLIVPSPKSQDQLETLPLERSVKPTSRGAKPVDGLTAKAATGGPGATVKTSLE
jgi:hypothetical protein